MAIFIGDSKNSNDSWEFQKNSRNSKPTMEPRTSKSYQEEVLGKYKREKGGDMRGYLAEPTCSQIRDACIYLLGRRNEKNDDYILNRFFEFNSEHDRLREIENFGIGKFKSIEKFLKGEIKQTSTKNINLISWLIDFHPRPYEEFLKSDNPTHTQEPEKQEIDHGDPLHIFDNQTPTAKPKVPIKKRRRLIIRISTAIVCILVTFLILLFWPTHNNGLPNPSDMDECMAWADSLYVQVPCTSKPYSEHGTKVEPMDRVRMNSFKKVEVGMATLFFSADDKPMLWYHKNKEGEIEYFTAPGLHPINGETLRKITPYIIQTYVPLHSNKKDSFLE